ncbi:hypothetical protein DIPPA_21643 [Diplonema papillatum]|nr:hypothetical protein DIPPA_21643 [Diplonema papillatum]
MALRQSALKLFQHYPLRSPNFKQRADKAFWRPWSLFPWMHTQYPWTDALKANKRKRLETERPAEAWRWDTNGNVWLPNEHEQEEFNSLPYVGVGHLYEELNGTKHNPIVMVFSGAEDDEHYFACSGDCAPNMGKCPRYFRIWGNTTSWCSDCGQHFYAKCVEDVVLDPDCPRNWPDHPRFRQPLLFEEVEELIEEWLDRGVEVMLY